MERRPINSSRETRGLKKGKPSPTGQRFIDLTNRWQETHNSVPLDIQEIFWLQADLDVGDLKHVKQAAKIDANKKR